MKPGPKPLLGTTMTHAERQARYRASHAERTPKVRYRRPADHQSRLQRWRNAVELIGASEILPPRNQHLSLS